MAKELAIVHHSNRRSATRFLTDVGEQDELLEISAIAGADDH